MKQALAANVRRLRVAQHLSLSELSRATGVSKGALSGIERATGNPTVETLDAISRALRVPVGQLLEEPKLAPVHIVRASVAAKEAAKPTVRSLDAVDAAGVLDVAELSLPSRHMKEIGPRDDGARTLILVLAGSVVAGPVERPSELSVGDYASFPADEPHLVEAGPRPARVLLAAHTPR